jgi:hypothetical protein
MVNVTSGRQPTRMTTMPERTTAAGQIWPHLPHDDERVAKQSKRTVADAMWPSLSRAAREQQTWEARAQAEQKERSRRTAENLQSVLDSLRAERGR